LSIAGASRGFTLVEVIVSIAVLALGVITAGAMMITVEHGSNFSENRYRDHAELRARVEDLKWRLGTNPLGALSTISKFTTNTGHDGSGTYELQAAGFSNLIRVELSVGQEGPVLVTYLRADDA
jgi:prepilin-type N-terminal cleavage/methylation domain-containing protein